MLRPGGRLALQEVCCADAPQPHSPVPWAGTDATSFLVIPEELREWLQDHGLAVTQWRGRERGGVPVVPQAPRDERRDPLSPGAASVMGPNAGAKIANLSRSLEEGRVCLLQVVAERC